MAHKSSETIIREEEDLAMKTLVRGYMVEGVSVKAIDKYLKDTFPQVSKYRRDKARREAFKEEAITDKHLIEKMGEHRALLFEMYRALFFKAMAENKVADARALLKDLSALLGVTEAATTTLVQNNFSGPTAISAPQTQQPEIPKIEESDRPVPVIVEQPKPIEDDVFDAEILGVEDECS